MPNKVWRYKNKGCTDSEIAELSRLSRVPPIIALLLRNRGITNPQEVHGYIRKTLGTVHDPSELDDMDKAASRLVDAIKNHEKITVYGDYDVDGVTSTALAVRFLRKHGADVSYYIPSRESEGYGINVMAVNKIARSGTKLMLTVDCGITACGEVELAKTMGMEVIITDHHLCKDKLPAAYAVVDPKRPGSKYPFDGLAGVGVTFKLVLAAAKLLGGKTADCFFEYANLAAIGTVADIVPLLDENRVIADKGIKLVQDSKNPGIKALLAVSGADKRPVNATAVAFMIAPRINAGGRLGSADKAVELLLTDDDAEAAKLAAELEEDNRERRQLEQKIFEEAMEMIAADPDFDKKKVIVLGGSGWHPGVIGIVASRVTEKFYKPSIMISFDEKGNGKGSARSIEGFNMFEALTDSAEILTNFGGHAMAAGVGVAKADIDAFSEKINKYAKERLTPEDMVAKIDIDCELPPKLATAEIAELLEYMEPFGAENPKPVFSMCGVKINKISQMGADLTHLRMVIEKNGIVLNAVGFRMGGAAEHFSEGEYVNIAFTLEINNFRGEKNAQLILKDINGRGDR